MTALVQARIQWTGMSGGPGISTFYWLDSDGVQMAAMRTFFEAIKANMPPSVTIKYPVVGNTIDDSTGLATGTWSTTAQSDTVGTNTGGYSAASGAVINWHTGIFTAGRELRGKTFLVPLGNLVYGTDGRIIPAAISSYKAAAAPLYAGTKPIRVYSPTAHTSAPVTGTDVPAKAVVLRSRRD